MQLTSKNAIKVLVMIWILALISSIPSLVEYSVYTTNESLVTHYNDSEFPTIDGCVLASTVSYETIELSTNDVTRNDTSSYQTSSQSVTLTNEPGNNTAVTYADNSYGMACRELMLSTSAPKTQLSKRRETYVLHHNCGGTEMPYIFHIISGFFLLFIAYLIPLVIICVNYTKLISFILREARGAQEDLPGARRTVMKKKMKILKMLIIVTALFALCWLPYFTVLIIAVSHH